jgi:hypothetical protein
MILSFDLLLALIFFLSSQIDGRTHNLSFELTTTLKHENKSRKTYPDSNNANFSLLKTINIGSGLLSFEEN